jgi:hypothetical protein
MNANKNWQCDGDRCREAEGAVKLYPLGGGANLILCHACWARENQYRYRRGMETKNPEGWPQQDWAAAAVYWSPEKAAWHGLGRRK